MSRIAFVVPPLTGHVTPTLAIARALTDAGHTVAWIGHPSRVGPLLPPGATLLPLPEGVAEDAFAEGARVAGTLRGAAAFKFLWQDFLVPLAHGMHAGVRDHVAAWAPDVLAVDQQALAGAVVARQTGLPWATVVSTSAGVTDEVALLPKVEAWRDAQLTQVAEAHGLTVPGRLDLSPHAVIVLSTRALVGDATLPPHTTLTGPALGGPRRDAPFPFERLDHRPTVCVTLGTVNAERGARFYQVVLDAFADAAVQVVMGAPEALVPTVPDHVIRQPWLPLHALYPHLDAVICHGGHNTTCEALSHGLPLVIAPIKDDQPVVARQVQAAGAGLRVRFGRVSPLALREAVQRVLDEPSFADAAARVAVSFREAGGAARAATVLVGLAGRA